MKKLILQREEMSIHKTIASITLFLALALLTGMLWKQSGTKSDTSTSNTTLLLYCAASNNFVIEEGANEYQEKFGASVDIQHGGGSATLLSNLQMAIWDATVAMYDQLEAVKIEVFSDHSETVSAAVLKSSTAPAEALGFLRYLAAPEKGQLVYKKYGFCAVPGDSLGFTPSLVLYSSGLNRIAFVQSIKEFVERQGVQITSIYNECEAVSAQIRVGKYPDAYFPCNISFMSTFQDKFLPAKTTTKTPLIIVTEKFNPYDCTSVHNLVNPGIRIGLTNPKQRAFASLTKRYHRHQQPGLHEKILPNVLSQTPTAELLVNRI